MGIMKNLIITLLTFLTVQTFAQKDAGIISYTYERDWLKMIEKDKSMSNDEKARALQTWKNDATSKQYMDLQFNPKGSLYEKGANERGSSWEKVSYSVRRDFENQKVYETQMIAGKVQLVEDSLYTYPWKIKSEIKEVAGYLCMLATTYDTLRKYDVQAWFTTDIPVGVGPEDFHGLPGAILELNVNDGVVVITATAIKLNPAQQVPALPKKSKGKKITREVYHENLKKFFKASEKDGGGFWGLRY
jgi:GLPGLI family protein